MNKHSGIIRAELSKNIQFFVSLSLLIFLSGCTKSTDVPQVHPTTTLLPFTYASPTTLASETPLKPAFTELPTLSPSATPFIHVIQKDDTLLAIAYRYGVSMDDLLAANPGIDPRILSIDQEIIIPLGEGDLVSDFLPTATPIPVQLSKVDCYPNQIRGLLCISTLENDSGGDLEAVSVVISIQDRNGAILREKTAFSPLNIIPESAQFPFAVTFDDFTDEFAYAMVTPVSAFPARAISERYSSVEIMLDVSEPSSDLISWWVEGRILSESREGYKLKQTSILIVALDEDKHVIGFRTIKIDPKDSTDDEISFAIEVPSLGPPIHQIALYSEIPLESGEE